MIMHGPRPVAKVNDIKKQLGVEIFLRQLQQSQANKVRRRAMIRAGVRRVRDEDPRRLEIT